jgi:hypothetical protein
VRDQIGIRVGLFQVAWYNVFGNDPSGMYWCFLVLILYFLFLIHFELQLSSRSRRVHVFDP